MESLKIIELKDWATAIEFTGNFNITQGFNARVARDDSIKNTRTSLR